MLLYVYIIAQRAYVTDIQRQAYSDDRVGFFRIATASSTKLALWQPENARKLSRSVSHKILYSPDVAPESLSAKGRASQSFSRPKGGFRLLWVATLALIMLFIAMNAGRIYSP